MTNPQKRGALVIRWFYWATKAIYANSRGVEELLSKPLDPNLTSEFHGASALACACNRPNSRKVVDLLLEALADPNTLDGQDRTPMFIAVT